MKITVAGVGYVGLSLAVLLAQKNEVTAVTTTKSKVDMLNSFKSPIRDDEIERFFREVRNGERALNFKAALCDKEAYKDADLVIIATPTNYNDEDNSFDTSAVEDVIEKTLAVNPDVLMVIKSTVPIGYTEGVKKKYGIKNIIFSPEFLRESKALYDNLNPSRIIVGAEDDQFEEADMFINLLIDGALAESERNGGKLTIESLITHPTEAEAIKLFANTYLAVRVSYFNELDTYAKSKGLNVKEIIDGVCLDPRIGMHYNNPSFGYGGYCLPKDTKQLLANYKGVPQALISAVVEANGIRKQFIADEVLQDNPKKVGIYRLTMKSNSDNFRAAAIKDIIDEIEKRNTSVVIYEPTLENGTDFMDAKVVNDIKEFKRESDVILANRFDEDLLGDVRKKVYTRDVFSRD